MHVKSAHSFEISLSILNHLGRNLYRNFYTILGEAISNAWDADAKNVWISIEKETNSFSVIDDGVGMTSTDFQTKFLKIGYSKRKTSHTSPAGRPFIGRKGIGKLALLSCSKQVIIATKTVEDRAWNGGVIDNNDLDEAIQDDVETNNYHLNALPDTPHSFLPLNQQSGTVVHFTELHSGIKNSLERIREMIALSFRFEQLDPNFAIHVDGKQVTVDDLSRLCEKTQYLWTSNCASKDPFEQKLLQHLDPKNVKVFNHVEKGISGFIASVDKPISRNIHGTGQSVSVDVFVSGRVRQTDIFQRKQSAVMTENYLYGQFHIDGLDDEVDRFTSSRESILENDPKFNSIFENVLLKNRAQVFKEWSELRHSDKRSGDPESSPDPILAKEIETFNQQVHLSMNEITNQDELSEAQEVIDKWEQEILDHSRHNMKAYTRFFMLENYLRKYIETFSEALISASEKDEKKQRKLDHQRKTELSHLKKSVFHEIPREITSDLGYMGTKDLTNLADELTLQVFSEWENFFLQHTNNVYPMRNVVMHTSDLTSDASKFLIEQQKTFLRVLKKAILEASRVSKEKNT